LYRLPRIFKTFFCESLTRGVERNQFFPAFFFLGRAYYSTFRLGFLQPEPPLRFSPLTRIAAFYAFFPQAASFLFLQPLRVFLSSAGHRFTSTARSLTSSRREFYHKSRF